MLRIGLGHGERSESYMGLVTAIGRLSAQGFQPHLGIHLGMDLNFCHAQNLINKISPQLQIADEYKLPKLWNLTSII